MPQRGGVMSHNVNRRCFLSTVATAGTTVALGEWAAMLPISPARADEAKVTPDLVRFSADTEPIVKLILDTPREKCIAAVVEQFNKGLPYRHFLASLYLAAIRVGPWHNNPFDHVAYSIHSAQQ